MENVDYVDTFIAVAPDCVAEEGCAPPLRAGAATVASATFELIERHPYALRSSDVIFRVWADRQAIPEKDREASRAEFYARPRACLRSSDLGKRYGWGIHADAEGRLAVYGVDTPEYAALAEGTDAAGRPVKVTAAMRSKRSGARG